MAATDTGTGTNPIDIDLSSPTVGNETLEDFTSGQVTNPTLPPGTVNVAQNIDPDAAGTNIDPSLAQVDTGGAGNTAQGTVTTADTGSAAVTVDAASVAAAQGTAAQGEVSEKSTVQGQLAGLMDDVEGGNAPWADAAMRAANEAMAARGVGASSLAGAAISQSVLEAALPIAMQDAKTFGGMDLANLQNRQQTMLSNQSAKNAARQFNAASENDVNKFMADMQSTLLRFNAEQANAMESMNTSQANARAQFNASLKSAEAQFNAKNALIIAESNTQWRRSVNTENTATQNAVTAQNVAQMYGLSTQAQAELWQQQRDVFSWANQTSENEKDRIFSLTVHALDRSEQLKDADKAATNALYASLGGLASSVISSVNWGKVWSGITV